MILGNEANIGLIYYGPKWSWAEMVMGRNGHGPKWLWAEMTRNPNKYTEISGKNRKFISTKKIAFSHLLKSFYSHQFRKLVHMNICYNMF